MNIQLGNLNLTDVFRTEYIGEISEYLDSNGYTKVSNCGDVKKAEGNYHIYDIPRMVVFCGENKMKDFIEFLQRKNLVGKAINGRLGITYIDHDLIIN